MVSPNALEIARMKDAIIPENEAGITTLKVVSSFVAPRAYAPSRSTLGTADIASSLMEETIGMIIIPITIPALNALKTFSSGIKLLRKGVMK